MNGAIEHLPVLVINVHSRCNCRCAMCDIWKSTTTAEFSLEQLQAQMPDIERLGVQWIVFSGGEPLMHSDLFTLCDIVRARGIRVTVLTTGLLMARYAAEIAGHIDDLIVSLDGPPDIHDRIRRTPGAFGLIQAGMKRLGSCRPEFPVRARCTVQKANFHALRATCAAARELGLVSISYLAADLTSSAFGRAEPWPAERRQEVAPSREETAALNAEIEAMIRENDGLVADSPAHLRRIVQHFQAHLGLVEPAAPLCNAPWVSAVVETDGTVRPCFFHQPVGRINGAGLLQVINGDTARAFRDGLDVETNETCRRCPCSLYWQRGG